ncbi:MAG: hypothetical protein IJ520_06395 [Synergistaceae bacterium]|nr:hypothetical protein [Synergistaceae bacterium]MBR1603728.1 hypothetical protein [Synergistaceae bacterium]
MRRKLTVRNVLSMTYEDMLVAVRRGEIHDLWYGVKLLCKLNGDEMHISDVYDIARHDLENAAFMAELEAEYE